jgi:hypothetical protein
MDIRAYWFEPAGRNGRCVVWPISITDKSGEVEVLANEQKMSRAEDSPGDIHLHVLDYNAVGPVLRQLGWRVSYEPYGRSIEKQLEAGSPVQKHWHPGAKTIRV